MEKIYFENVKKKKKNEEKYKESFVELELVFHWLQEWNSLFILLSCFRQTPLPTFSTE